MTDRLSIESLRYAHAVAETGSFSSAAKAYGVTQPALSNGIAKLERQLGERLFDRTPRGASLTGFGQHLMTHIERALAGLDSVYAEAQKWTTPTKESIRVGVSPIINPQLIADAYTAVCTLPEPYDLVLREANMQDLRKGLVAGEFDLIIIPSVEPLPRYQHRLLAAEPVVLVEAQRDSDNDVVPETEQQASVDLGDIASQTFILVPNACGLTTFTQQLFAERGLALTAYPGEAASYQTLEQWAQLGLGEAILPESKLSSPNAPHRKLVSDDVEVEIFYEAVWDPETALAPDLNVMTANLSQFEAA